MTPALPEELSLFDDGEVTARGLFALAAAESLTDPLAHHLLRIALGEDAGAEDLVATLHLCDFVVERNSEWHLAPRIRETLVDQLTQERELSDRIHTRLLEFAEGETGSENAPRELPRYLQSGVGRAYHGTFLFAENVIEYGRLAEEPLSGQQWLAGYLADEQVRLGVIPGDTTEIAYLRGMILYRERRLREAEPFLRTVAERSESRHEVAVAAHLVGRMDGKRPQRRRTAESLLWKSLKILQRLNDAFGRAQVLHTLGGLIGRDRARQAEAEELLRESLEIGHQLDASLHVTQVLHTLGRLIGRDRARQAEAEDLLRESLDVKQRLNDIVGESQVLHTLGQLIGRDRARQAEAEELLRESLEIGRELNRLNHQAQVLYGLARLPGTPLVDAEALLQESLGLNRQIGNAHGERIVRQALTRLRAGQ